jgi:S-adenosylmethionine synthetase
MVSFFTSESVAAGHPDKICDQISDAVVDAAISADSKSRVAVETLVTTNRIVLAGEVTCKKTLDYENIARGVVKSLDFTNPLFNFTDKSPVSIYIHEQSPDIACGVDDGGAGDQGMMFGYASQETPEYMPVPIIIAHRMVEAMDNARINKVIDYLRPDGKCEVKVKYENGIPVGIEAVVIAVPFDPRHSLAQLKIDLIKKVIAPVLDLYKFKLPTEAQIIVNGSKGKWEIGGPASDSGVTGRKIIVDTYGGYARHGGGAFSGKDPTKVDRSAAYACRYLAKNIVAHKLAQKAEIRVAYVIGQRNPLDIEIETFGTGKKSDAKIIEYAKSLLDLSVLGIINGLKLRRPIYQETARYGHFGRNGFPWEQVVQFSR